MQGVPKQGLLKKCEVSCWDEIECLARNGGHGNWCDWFYTNRLHDSEEGLLLI